MILVDTSAWVEFLRGTGSDVCNRVDALLAQEIATCEPVRMELLAGARDDRHLDQLRRLLGRPALVSVAPEDYESAATLYRSCRRAGETVRKLIDCLIAAVAIRERLAILHLDSDFAVLARHTPLLIDLP